MNIDSRDRSFLFRHLFLLSIPLLAAGLLLGLVSKQQLVADEAADAKSAEQESSGTTA